MELIIIFAVLFVAAVWIGASLVALVWLLPAFIVVWIGASIGLSWWQSLLAAPFAYAFTEIAIERYRDRKDSVTKGPSV